MNINSLFWTVQGEGFHAGRRALFVRMPYCNLACPWCDTEFDSFKEWTDTDFAKKACEEASQFAVITGGEPSFHKHTPDVIRNLKLLNFTDIAMETNGNFPIPSGVDFVTVSPKKYSDRGPFRDAYYICPEAFKEASEFKYVVEEGFDFKILDRHDVNDGRRYSLSPEFTIFKKSLESILTFIKEKPQWRISLQTHKWMEIP